jgi:hypothetical protein
MKSREVMQAKDLWQLAFLCVPGDSPMAGLAAAVSFGPHPHAHFHCFPKTVQDRITGSEKR